MASTYKTLIQLQMIRNNNQLSNLVLSSQREMENQQIEVKLEKGQYSNISKHNDNIVVLQYIEPPRQLLKCNHKLNSVYEKQLNNLPPMLLSTDQLQPLVINSSETPKDYQEVKKQIIYERNMKLLINPFEPKAYIKNENRILRTKCRQFPIFKPKQLIFDSHFESGNLKVVEKEPFTHKYHLLMQNDHNTYGCTQWFFFKASNKECLRATFFINNFYKSKSLYQNGMRILIFSTKKSAQEDCGWIRGGEDITYFQNNRYEKKVNHSTTKEFYSLKFLYYFEYEEDEVYFAYNYPYTYSKMNSYLQKVLKQTNEIFGFRTLCKTIANNRVQICTITDYSVPKSNKRAIFITSRVHPGETVSSLIMEGIIDYLTGSDTVAKRLREHFIFKLVPILNPDGVIHGNYRTNLAGIDLNRVWETPDPQLCPQISELKRNVLEFNKQCKVIMFCDVHGHSAKKSVFVYGCEREKFKFIREAEQVRLFPYMLSSINDNFRFKSCTFGVQKCKRGTARVNLWKQLKIPNIFTLEASFCSAFDSEYHFRPSDYKQIGTSFCLSLQDYFLDPQKRQEMTRKLRNSQKIDFTKDKQEEDSESSNDLFDQKKRKKLKRGKIIEQIPAKTFIQETLTKKEQNQSVQRRHRKFYTQASQKSIDQSKTPNQRGYISLVPPPQKKKTLSTVVLTNNIFVESTAFKQSNAFRSIQRRNSQMRRSVYKTDQSYRGKSSLYRIKKRWIHGIIPAESIFRHDSTESQY